MRFVVCSEFVDSFPRVLQVDVAEALRRELRRELGQEADARRDLKRELDVLRESRDELKAQLERELGHRGGVNVAELTKELDAVKADLTLKVSVRFFRSVLS